MEDSNSSADEASEDLESLDRIKLLLNSNKDPAQLVDSFVSLDWYQLEYEILTDNDIVEGLTNSDFLPFILKEGVAGREKFLSYFVSTEGVFRRIVEKGLAAGLFSYLAKYSSDSTTYTHITQYCNFLKDYSNEQIKNQVLSVIFDYGKSLLLKETKRSAGQKALFALGSSEFTFLKKIGSDTDVVQSCWEALLLTLSPVTKGSIIVLLLRTENLGEDVAQCVASIDIDEFLLEELFAEFPAYAYQDLRWFLNTLMTSPYYPIFHQEKQEFGSKLYSSALPLLKSKEYPVKQKAAQALNTFSEPLENKPLAVGSEVYSILDWILSGDEKLYKLAVEYFSQITRHTSKVVIKEAAVVKTVINNLESATDAELTGFELCLLGSLALIEDAKRLLPADKIERAVTELIAKEGYLDADNKNRAYRLISLIFDSDKVGAIKIDANFVTSQVREITELLSATPRQIRTSLVELVAPWPNFTVNDYNKELLGKSGIIEPLVKIVTMTTPLSPKIAVDFSKVRVDACKTLWNLAFLEDNRELIKKAGGLDSLYSIANNQNNDPVLVENAKGVLWMFTLKPEATISANDNTAIQQNQDLAHIMISYHLEVHHTVLRLANALKEAGYRVWLDADQAQGNTLETRAAALEGSALVLICATEKYKESPKCRLEGEYCRQQKKPFIPLLVQESYKPNGWLGPLLGTKVYHNFATEMNWDTKVTALIREIGERGKTVSSIQSATKPAATTTLISYSIYNAQE